MPQNKGHARGTAKRSPRQAAAEGRTPRAAAIEAKAKLAATAGGKSAIQQPIVSCAKGQTPAKTASAAATTKKKRPGRAAKPVQPVYSMDIDGTEYAVGDDVYVAMTNYESEDEEDEECEVCHRASQQPSMLECSGCLRGFHMRCLRPPLRAVPEGDWLCPACERGEPRQPPSKLASRWSRLLYGNDVLGLARIEGFGRGKDLEGSDEPQWRCRYYLLPQETHVGRHKHHGSREVFLSNKTYNEPTYSIVGRAFVLSPEAFAAGPSTAEEEEQWGMDVFMCEYEYDETWKRFRKRAYADDAGAATAARAADSDWEAESGSDSEQEDAYQPQADRAQHWGRQAGCKRQRHGTLGSLGVAAQQAFEGLGATAVPEVRAPHSDPFSEVHARLSVSTPPSSLPCRDAEKEQLAAFTDAAVEGDGGSGILYLCGVPGTGKTASVNEVLLGARGRARAAGAQFVSINCLQLPSPQHVYSKLWECLSGQRLPPLRARDAMEAHIRGSSTGRRRYSTVVMLDEIDMLMTRDQQVLYNLFDWPAQSGARLALIAVSNTHDLEQRVQPRIASRLRTSKLAFLPYSIDQLKTIVRDRLEGTTLVEQGAIDYAARKVAAETGDVRRALELLRRAVEIAQAEHKAARKLGARTAAAGPSAQPHARSSRTPGAGNAAQQPAAAVLRTHVIAAAQEMFSEVHMQMLRQRSLFEKLLLVGVVLEGRATGKSSVVLGDVVERLRHHVCPLVELALPCPGMMEHVAAKVAATHLLIADARHLKAHIRLNVSREHVAIVVKDEPRLSRVHHLLM